MKVLTCFTIDHDQIGMKIKSTVIKICRPHSSVVRFSANYNGPCQDGRSLSILVKNEVAKRTVQVY